ncbi:MAG: hypothetical protein Crog4KO_29750 [Crocinitomicaceae bacterium]
MDTTEKKDVIAKNQWFNHPIQKVWEAITNTEQVSKWLVPTNFKAEVGFQYALHDPKAECNVVTGTVLKASPYTLVYSWINETVKDVETLITWELTEENGGTRLSMTHSGISNYSKAQMNDMIDSYSSGWIRCFDNLNELLP